MKQMRIVIESTERGWTVRSLLQHFRFFWKGSRARRYTTFEDALLDLASTNLTAQKAAGMPVPGRKHRRRLAQKLVTRLVR